MEIRRILVGVDFSEPSKKALDYAAALALRLGSEVELVHVYQIPAFAFPDTIVPAPPEPLERMISESRRHLETLGDRLRQQGIKATTELLPGSPFAELVGRAHEGGFDLVIVGTHGRTGLRHALLGSVAEKVVRRSLVPVLTVRADEPPEDEE